jgi:hypothetical protein
MAKVPKQRGGGSGQGGGNHSQSRFTSTRRGGQPSLGGGGKKGSGCALFLFATVTGIVAGIGAAWEVFS